MGDSALGNDIPSTSGQQAGQTNGNEEQHIPKRKSRKRTHDNNGNQPCCTKQRCGLKLISSQTRENLKQEYNEEGNAGHGFAYLRRYISAKKITNPHGKRKQTCRYHIPNGAEQVEVCQIAFRTIFDIKERALRDARDEKDVVPVRRNLPDARYVPLNGFPEIQETVEIKQEPPDDDDDVIIIHLEPPAKLKCTCSIGRSVQFESKEGTTLEQFKSMTNWPLYTLKEETLVTLYREDYTSVAALQVIKKRDLKSLQSHITNGQIALLRSFIRCLNCKRHQPSTNGMKDLPEKRVASLDGQSVSSTMLTTSSTNTVRVASASNSAQDMSERSNQHVIKHRYNPGLGLLTDEAEKMMARAPSTSAMSDRSFPLQTNHNDHPRPVGAPSTASGESCNSTSHQNNQGNDISLLLQLVEASISHGSLQVALPSIAQVPETDSSQSSATYNHDDPQHTGIPDHGRQYSKSPATAAFIPESTILYNPSSEFSGNFSQEQNLQNGLGLLSSAASFIPRTVNNRSNPYEDAERDDKEPENPQGSTMDAPRNCEAALNNPIGLEKRLIHNGKQQTTQGTMQPRDSTNDSLATQYADSAITSSHINVNRQHDTNNAVINHVPTIPMLKKKWKRCGQIKLPKRKAKYPWVVAIHPNGDFAVTSIHNPVAVFSRNGKFKHTIQGSPSYAYDIAITPSNQYIIPGDEEFYTYDSQGQLLNTIPTYDINNQPSCPTSVAVDSRGRIIVGLGVGNHKTVSIHQPDGTLISKFQTQSPPLMITCTPDDNLIISFDDDTLQVMDQSGHNARIIQPPPDIESWKPYYVCCSKQGVLFVGNQGYSRGVYRYVCADGEYKYLDCIATTSCYPRGIALSANEEELFVVNRQDNCIQVFR